MDGDKNLSFTCITDHRSLRDICRGWDASWPVALDTEFIRTNTFFPKAGLFQIANPARVYLIDPLAIDEWDDFRSLISGRHGCVIMHSCSEDLNLLRHFLDCLPYKLFDTQRAAAYLGYGLSVSYQALLAAELDITIGKGETRSDWLARPLSSSQLEYAALDVVYLHALCDKLTEKLKERGRLEWFEQDCSQFLVTAEQDDDEQNWERYYRNIGGAWRLGAEELLVLQKLCYWREKTARERDRPRSWIVNDTDLLSLCVSIMRTPLSIETISRTTSMKSPYLDRDGESLIAFLGSGFQPVKPAVPDEFSKPLSPRERKLLKRGQQIVASLASAMGIAPELLARKRHLLELIERNSMGQQDPWPDEITGWRKQLLEPLLAEILVNDE
ncbi:MAG: ribonuclease D [Pseudohongiellaceae bacterium]